MSSQENDKRNTVPKPLYVRNFPCFSTARFDPNKVEAAMDYKPRDGDVVLCSYPKTGTTWIQYIIWQILHPEKPFPNFADMQKKSFPYMDFTGVEAIEMLPSPRCYKTHISYPLLNINKHAKYIYVHRNPMDTLLSNFHFQKNIHKRSFLFDDFFESFMQGEVPSGDYFDHVLSFELLKDDSHLHMFSYKDLHKDKKGQILRIAKILGDEYHEALLDDEERMQKLLNVTDFHYMKQNVNTDALFKEENVSRTVNYNIFRQGIIGAGKIALSSEQMDRLHQKMLIKMRGTRFISLWSELMVFG